MNEPNETIAVVGMSGRFPGADDVESFWSLIVQGRSGLKQLQDRGTDEKHHVPIAAVVHDHDTFDAEFFGIHPREAALMDPQHRILLEEAWLALEDAGCEPDRDGIVAGVFAGCGPNRYLIENLAQLSAARSFLGAYNLNIASDKDFLATRVAYKLNLRGPSLTVQTACSTSLVAIHLACQSLLTHECDLALAGGVSLQIPHGKGYQWHEDAILSPSGACRPFDATADGTVPGSGAAIVCLQRLSDAKAQRRRIYAVICGTAVNNDGADKVGYAAPNPSAQAEVVALAHAGHPISQIGYIEAHGTGTVLGDAAELSGLLRVFRHERDVPCVLGSLKANVGHLDAASGVAGLVKATLCLRHKTLAPMRNFERPTEALSAAGGQFEVLREARSWTQHRGARFAGVSSFGIGGTNVHVALQEYTDAERLPETGGTRPLVFPLSARTEAAYHRARLALADCLSRQRSLRMDDLAYTLQRGRKMFRWRNAFVACTPTELADRLKADTHAVDAQSEVARAAAFVFAAPSSGLLDALKRRVRTDAAFAEGYRHLLQHVRGEHAGRIQGAMWGAGLDPFVDTDESPSARAACVLGQLLVARCLTEDGVVAGTALGDAEGHVAALAFSGKLSIRDAIAVSMGEPLSACSASEGDSGRSSSIRLLDPQTGFVAEDVATANGSARLTALAASRLKGGEDLPVELGIGELCEQFGWRNGALLRDESDSQHWRARHVAHLWRSGVRVRWSKDGSGDARICSLPPYPFERQRHWIEAAANPPAASVAQSPELRLHIPVWRRSSPPPVPADAPTCCLVLVDDTHLLDVTARKLLTERGTMPVVLAIGRRFRAVSDTQFVLDPDDPEHLLKMWTALQRSRLEPEHLIHCRRASHSQDDASSLSPRYAGGYTGALHLVQWLRKRGRPLRSLVLVTCHGVMTPADRSISVSEAVLPALAASLEGEFSGLQCACVDVPETFFDTASPEHAAYARWLADERPQGGAPALVAYRNGQRMVQSLTSERLDSGGALCGLTNGGCYLITGGLGRIGLQLARHLVSRHKARIALLARSAIPPKEQWQQLVSGTASPTHIAEIARTLLELEAQGADLLLGHGDVAEPSEVGRFVDEARARFGRIDGVFHLAAELNDASAALCLANITPEALLKQARPKLMGLRALAAALEHDEIDFAVAFSSNAALLGGTGLAAYAAANAALNAAVTALQAKSGQRWLAICWDAWGAVSPASPSAISFPDGFAALTAILASRGEPVVHVADRDLTRFHSLGESARPRLEPAAHDSPPGRPKLDTPYVAPRTKLEADLARIFEGALGYGGVGVDDDMYDLGGDSLTALTILGSINDEYGVDVPLREFVEGRRTVARVAQVLVAQMMEESESPATNAACRTGGTTDVGIGGA